MEPLETSEIKPPIKVTKPKVTTKRRVTKVSKSPKKKSARLPRTKIKLGTVHLFVENEQWEDEVDLPQYPVENGKNITDHVDSKPDIVTLKGVYFSDSKHSYNEKKKKLREYQKKGTRLTYAGRRTGRNLAVRKIETIDTSEIKNGTEFVITLQEIRIISKYKKKKKKTTASRKQTKSKNTKKKTTAGKTTKKYHTIRRGDTYWELGIKYGIKWQTLYSWNKYPIRALPIGKKMRVR